MSGRRRAQVVHAAGAVALNQLAHAVEAHGREEPAQRELGFALLFHHGPPEYRCAEVSVYPWKQKHTNVAISS